MCSCIEALCFSLFEARARMNPSRRQMYIRYGKDSFLCKLCAAGINIPRLLVDPAGKEELTEELFDRMVAVNQKGAFLCAQARP